MLELHPFKILISTLLLPMLALEEEYGFWDTTIFGVYCCFVANLEAGLLLVFAGSLVVDVGTGVWFVGFLSMFEDLELFYFVSS